MSKRYRSIPLIAATILCVFLTHCGDDTLSPNTEITFPDTILGNAICESLNRVKGPIPVWELQTIDTFRYNEGGVVTLEGLQYCTDLVNLQIAWCWVEDLEPITGLRKLEELDLWDNKISDLEPLVILFGLRRLDLGENDIRNIAYLSHLINIEWLNLSANPVSNISALKNMTKLKTLHLTRCNITDIKPLVENPGLGEGDEVYLDLNPLSEESVNVYIPRLEARGVIVQY